MKILVLTVLALLGFVAGDVVTNNVLLNDTLNDHHNADVVIPEHVDTYAGEEWFDYWNVTDGKVDSNINGTDIQIDNYEVPVVSKMQISEVFGKIQPRLNQQLVLEVNATYQFILTSGAEIMKWFVDLKTGNGTCSEGELPDGKADVTFQMDAYDFLSVCTGKLDPMVAFEMGKIVLEGDFEKALKIQKLFEIKENSS